MLVGYLRNLLSCDIIHRQLLFAVTCYLKGHTYVLLLVAYNQEYQVNDLTDRLVLLSSFKPEMFVVLVDGMGIKEKYKSKECK
jgi:hypothetical protein